VNPEAAARAACWTRALPLEDLASTPLRVWRHGEEQILLVRTGGEVFAVDNRCPHEGYPLHTGTLAGCALTCPWHNWKFDVRDGSCLLGEEGVRRYPVRVVDGMVEVDLAEPDPAEQWPRLLRSFHDGLHEHQNERVARDGARLILAGFPAERLLLEVALHDARHAEYGTTHATAAAAECLRFLDRLSGPEAMAAVAVSADMCGEANRRLPERPRAEAIPGSGLEDLRRTVEDEDAARAEGLLRGALRAGLDRSEAFAWLADLLADHFLDFGHPLIYLVKLDDLLGAVEASDAEFEDLLAALLYSIVLGTREDTLPYLAPYFEGFGRGALAALAGREGPAPESEEDLLEAVREAALDAPGRPEAAAALRRALEAGVGALSLARALLLAAAERFLRFDLEVDRDPGLAENWIWVTHRLTFAMAVLQAVERWPGPGALRFLVQSLAFTHSGRGMDAPPERRPAWETGPADPERVLAALAGKDAATALATAAGCLRDPAAAAALRRSLEDLCLQDPAVRPIVVVHVLKTLLAAFDARDALGEDPRRDLPVLATVRFLASPVRERRVHEQVHRALDWVVHGRIPRKRTQ